MIDRQFELFAKKRKQQQDEEAKVAQDPRVKTFAEQQAKGREIPDSRIASAIRRSGIPARVLAVGDHPGPGEYLLDIHHSTFGPALELIMTARIQAMQKHGKLKWGVERWRRVIEEEWQEVQDDLASFDALLTADNADTLPLVSAGANLIMECAQLAQLLIGVMEHVGNHLRTVPIPIDVPQPDATPTPTPAPSKEDIQ